MPVNVDNVRIGLACIHTKRLKIKWRFEILFTFCISYAVKNTSSFIYILN